MKVLNFIKKDFWQLTPDAKRPVRSFFIKFGRITFSSIVNFIKDECYLKASLLTFYSLVSVVPVLAVTLAIAKGFGFDTFLEKQILQTFREQKDVLSKAIEFSYSFIKHMRSQIVVGLGVLFLFFSIFGLLENIEKSLNQIWKVAKSRSALTKLIDYLAIIIICPIIFTASSSLTVFLNVQIAKTLGHYEFLQRISTYLPNIFQLLPFFLSWFLFSFIYLFTPHTRIYFKTRVFAAILAGTLFQLWQIAYIQFQVVITSYNAIYGSFAALPLFLIWLQVNWIIFLLGAQIAANMENDLFYNQLKASDQFIKLETKELILLVLYQYVLHFDQGLPPPAIVNISKQLSIPLTTLRKILNILEEEKILTEVKGQYKERYQLTKNPKLYTIKTISDIFEKHFSKQIYVKATDISRKINQIYEQMDQSIAEIEQNLTIKELADRLAGETPPINKGVT